MARLLRSRSIIAAAAVAAVLVVAVALTAAGASTPVDLPRVSAERLIASSISAVADRSLSLSGTVETHVDLGIPQLPGMLSDPTGPAGLLLSDQTFKVWRSPAGARVAQILPSAERDVIVTPTDLWLWDSPRFAAWHAGLPGTSAMPSPPSLADIQTVVSRLLAKLVPYADLTTAEPIEVADRPAYVLRLTPASSRTLVDHVDVAIDAATRAPLAFDVFATGRADAVVRAGYTSISFGPIDPSVFAFTPPAGAAVHELRPPIGHEAGHDADHGEMPQVRWFGTGFDLIAAVPVRRVPEQLAPLFPYAGPLGSADVVQAGGRTWILAGLVPPDALARVGPELR